ncbi:MAG TPA: UDP-2,4-diacetamido-2,4,6-trideoxy-beta-L-altropyranose hydrolase [Nautiliaceae bacterium]|nr:UDP-2,4-diacetamido-2,4,6-trideoxy-beta-L-altropyranose hydrolase [Nautiliaceae bacterium]
MVIIRADSSSTIGTGHIMRDLVLAKKFKQKVIFATRDLKGNINYKIKEAGYQIAILKDNSYEEFSKIIKKYNPKTVVIDNYEIDYEFEKRLKKEFDIILMVLDDTYKKHYCDILLNHNIYADANRYKGLVPKHCELRCGKKYTLIRDEFIEAKKRIPNFKSSILNIFIAMGGADHSNKTIEILEVLKNFKNIKANVVITSANKNLDKLKEYVQNKEWINLYIDTNNIASIMENSNLAIVTPSVILNEVFFMELPFIAIKTASNQEEMVKYLKNNNYLVLEAFNKNKLYEITKRWYEE